MLDIHGIDFSCFFFNNKFSDEYGIIAAGTNPLVLSALPSKTTKTETILGKQGIKVVSSQWNPRPFLVNITFTDMTNFRDGINWISSLVESDFYWKGDSVKIRARLDDQQIDTLTLGYLNYLGQQNKSATLQLKFIADYPFYQDIYPQHYIFQNGTPSVVTTNGYDITITGSLSAGINFNCNGNQPCFPLIKINGTGAIVGSINGNSINMNNIVSYIYIDMYKQIVYKVITDFSTNQIDDYIGVWQTLNAGLNSIAITSGTYSSIEIWTNAIYI